MYVFGRLVGDQTKKISERRISHSVTFNLPFPIYNNCLPLDSIGKHNMVTNAARISAPAANTGALGFAVPA